MQVNGINGISNTIGQVGSQKNESGSFSDILTEAVNNVKETEEAAKQGNISLLTGETDDLHTPVIEAQKAELALNLAIQVRNKVIEAYNEIMRMQV